MTKKSRRVRRKGASPRLSQAQLVQPSQVEVSAERPGDTGAVVEPTQQTAKADFREEYHYVVSDLKRLGIIAAAMLGGLLILSLIL